MKKSMLALAALTAFAGAASAQSSVTLFGIVDLAARSVTNGSAGSLKTLSPNGQASSRLGFRGIEDMGGGLRAGFWLEGDLQADTGNAAGMLWNRRSTVSLIGNFGEVRMGRDYVPTFVNMSTYDMWGYQGVSTIANLRTAFVGNSSTVAGQGGVTTGVRANNSISYFLPAMGGLYGQVTVAPGETVQGNKHMGARLGYAAGPLNVSAAYGKTDKSGNAIDDLKTINFGGSFNFGFLTAQASYEKSDYSVNYQKLASAGVLIPIGSGTIKLNYMKAGSNLVTNQAKLLGAGYVYDLSKRTSLGVGFGRISNGAGARFTASGNGINTAAFKAGETSTGYDFSLRHNF
jgi:predicted porin